MNVYAKVLSVSALIVVTTNALSGEMSVPNFDLLHFPQERKDYCGAAIAQSWICHLSPGNCPGQSTFASLFGGLSSYDMEKVLERYTGRSFDVQGHSGDRSARERIYTELKSVRPLAIAGATVKPNGDIRPGGHWRIIWSADIAGGGSAYKLNWAQVIDPLYKSAWASEYVTYSPYKTMSSKELFDRHWKVFPNGTRQSVED